MITLGIETSCDETGVALYHSERGLLAHRLHSQVSLHAEYGGVVPELASRDHIRRLPVLWRQALAEAGMGATHIDVIACTRGPGLAGALLVGTSFACGLARALDRPLVPIHHLEGHLLSPLLEEGPPDFPFVALLVSGGHSQLLEVRGVGQYRLLGDTLDDAAGEAFDKSAQLLGLGYPGGARLAQLAADGDPRRISLPRPMLHSGDLDFSFSGLKTAVRLAWEQGDGSDAHRADLAASFQEAVTDVLAAKALAALAASGITRLVVAGGVGANLRLREKLAAGLPPGARCHFPRIEFCTDNGAMIALAGALRAPEAGPCTGFGVQPRWSLETLRPPAPPAHRFPDQGGAGIMAASCRSAPGPDGPTSPFHGSNTP